MKHTIKITIILVLLFLAAQIIGLTIVDRYVDKEKSTEKIVGIVEWVIGIIDFISCYLNVNSPFDSAGALENVVFYGLFGITFFISGTITYLKSLDFLDV